MSRLAKVLVDNGAKVTKPLVTELVSKSRVGCSWSSTLVLEHNKCEYDFYIRYLRPGTNALTDEETLYTMNLKAIKVEGRTPESLGSSIFSTPALTDFSSESHVVSSNNIVLFHEEGWYASKADVTFKIFVSEMRKKIEEEPDYRFTEEEMFRFKSLGFEILADFSEE